jgi:hypothetical protein
MKWSAVSIGAAAVLLAGCTQSTGIALPDPPAPSSAPAAPTVPAANPADPVALGSTLAVTRAGAEVEVTVFAVNQNAAPDSWPAQGGHWAGADIETCLKKADSGFAVKSTDWTATDGAGIATVGSALTDAAFPRPGYPATAPLEVGQCVRGWTMFPAGFKAVVTTVAFTPEAGPPAAVWDVTLDKNRPGQPD